MSDIVAVLPENPVMLGVPAETKAEAVEIVEEPMAAPAPALPTIVHLSTKIVCTFAVLDRENNARFPSPITLELDTLSAQSLTAVLARIKEERQKFAQQVFEAGIL